MTRKKENYGIHPQEIWPGKDKNELWLLTTDTVKTSVYFRLGCNLCQPRSYKLNRKSAMTPDVTKKSTANKRENKKS